jgi:hypothetical protein
VKVLQKDNLTKTVPETIYVGNLKSDDYDTEKLTIETSNIEPTKYTLKLQLQYQDIFGKSYQDDREIDISITQKQAGFPVALAAGIIFVLLIVGVFVYTKMRRKK